MKLGSLHHLEATKSLLLTAYTIYAFFFAQNNDSIGNSFLLGMSLVAIASLYFSKMPMVQIKAGTKIFVVLFGFAFITTLSSLWSYSHADWTFTSACKFILCYLVVIVFSFGAPSKSNLFKTTAVALCIGLSLLMILQNSGFEVKKLMSLTGLHPVDFDWNEKYHSFWLVFLLWLVISQTWRNNKKAVLLSILIFVVAALAIATSYSDSAKLALAFSAFVFLLSKFSTEKLWKTGLVLILAYVILFPLIWHAFAFSGWDWLPERLYIRVLIFETTSNAIGDQWFWGHGFGSTLTMQITNFLPESAPPSTYLTWFSTQRNGLFPGAHPHNIVALIWLDFGFLGAVALAYCIIRFSKHLRKASEEQESASSILALVASALVIFSLSFSIWQTDVVLTYAMFFSCLMSLCSVAHVSTRE